MSEQINHIAEVWWGWMWPMFWQVGVVVGLVWLVDLVIRRRVWPQVRYALWLLVLLKLILPPGLASPTSVTWRLEPLAEEAVNRQWFGEDESPAVHAEEIISATRLLDYTPEAGPASTAQAPMAVKTVTDMSGGNLELAEARQTLAKSGVRLCWKAYIMFAWFAGALVLTGWLVVRFRQLRRRHLGKKGEKRLPRRFGELLAEAAKKLRLRRLPEVVLSRHLVSPAVFGVFRPVLLMPADEVYRLPRRELEHVLLHELSHIKRGDLKINAFFMVLQIVYWFNPLLWLVRRQLQHLRELCCDAAVARILREKTTGYRETILETARRLLAKPVEPGMGLLGLFEDSSRLMTRLKWLEKKTWKYRGLRIATVLVIVAVMAACVLPMAQYKWLDKDLLVRFTEHEKGVAQRTESLNKMTLMKRYDVEFAPGEELLVVAELYQTGRPMQRLGHKVFEGTTEQEILTASFSRSYRDEAKTVADCSLNVSVGEQDFAVGKFEVPTPEFLNDTAWRAYEGEGIRRLRSPHNKKEYAKFDMLLVVHSFTGHRDAADDKRRRLWMPGYNNVTQVGFSSYYVLVKMIPVSRLEHLEVDLPGLGSQKLDGGLVPEDAALAECKAITAEYRQMIFDAVEGRETADEFKAAVPNGLLVELVGVRPDGGDDIYDANGKKIAEDTFVNIDARWSKDSQYRTFIFELPVPDDQLLFTPFLEIRPAGGKHGLSAGQRPLVYSSDGNLTYSVGATLPRTYKRLFTRRIRQVDLTLRYYYGGRGKADFVFKGPFTPGQTIKAEGGADCELTAKEDRLNFSNHPAAFFKVSSKTRFDDDSVLLYDVSGQRHLPEGTGGRSGQYGSSYEYRAEDLTLDWIAYVTVGEKPCERTFENVVVHYPHRPARERMEYLDRMGERLGLSGLTDEQLYKYEFENPADAIKAIDIVRGLWHVREVFEAIVYAQPKVDVSTLDEQSQQKVRLAAKRWAEAGEPRIRAAGIRLGLYAGWPEFLDLTLTALENNLNAHDILRSAYHDIDQKASREIAGGVDRYGGAIQSEQADRIRQIILRTPDARIRERLFTLFRAADKDVTYEVCRPLASDERAWVWWPAMSTLLNKCTESLRPFGSLSDEMLKRLILVEGDRPPSSPLFEVSASGKDYATLAEEAYSMLPGLFTPELAQMNGSVCHLVREGLVDHVDQELAERVMIEFLHGILTGPMQRLWAEDNTVFHNCCVQSFYIARQFNRWYGVDIGNVGTTYEEHGERIPHHIAALKGLIAETLQWYESRSNEADKAGGADGKTGQSRFKATLANGVTVELVGVCEHPSEGKQWWRPDGTLLEEAPIREDRGINVTTGIDRLGRKFAVKLTKLPEGFSDNFADNLKYEIVPCYDHGLSGPVFKNGKPLSDIWLISGSIPSENTHCTLKLLISNDKWVEFKNVSLRPGGKTDVESEPVLLEELNRPERPATSPCLSADGLTMYFGRQGEQRRIYEAYRAVPNGLFISERVLSELYNGEGIYTPCVSPDGLRLYYSEFENFTTRHVIRMAERASPSGSWTKVRDFYEIHVEGGADFGPSLTADELTMFFRTDRNEGVWEIWQATRSSKQEPFSNPMPVSELNDGDGAGGVCIMPDGLTIYFAAIREGRASYDIYKATRLSTDDPFGNIELISISSDVYGEFYPFVATADEGTLYFAQHWGEERGIYVSYWRPQTITVAVEVGGEGGWGKAQDVEADQNVVELNQLIERLSSSDGVERAMAAYRLGEMGEKAAAAAPQLIELLKEGHTGQYLTVSKKEGSNELEVGSFWTGGIITEEDLEMPDSSGSACWVAAAALRKIGRAAVPALIEASKQDSRELPMHVCEILGDMGDPDTFEALFEMMKDRDGNVSSRAIAAVRKINHPDTVERLIEALKDENQYLRQSSAEALGYIKDAEAVGPLIDTLKDKDENVRINAAKALARINDRRALEPLLKMLEDESEYVRCGVAGALGSIDNPQVIEKLIRVLGDEHESMLVRGSAAGALGNIGRPQAAAPLIRFLHETKPDDSAVRGWTVEALGKIAHAHQSDDAVTESLSQADIVRALITTLSDADGAVRWRAATALVGLKDPRAVEPLIANLKYDRRNLRSECARALGEIGDRRAVPPLIGALKDGYWEVRALTAEALGKLGDVRAVEPLIQLLSEDAAVSAKAAWALGRIGDARAIEPLIASLGRARMGSTKQATAEALKRLTGQDFEEDWQQWHRWWQEQQNTEVEVEGAGKKAEVWARVRDVSEERLKFRISKEGVSFVHYNGVNFMSGWGGVPKSQIKGKGNSFSIETRTDLLGKYTVAEDGFAHPIVLACGYPKSKIVAPEGLEWPGAGEVIKELRQALEQQEGRDTLVVIMEAPPPSELLLQQIWREVLGQGKWQRVLIFSSKADTKPLGEMALKRGRHVSCRTPKELMEAFVELARKGDPAAGKLFMERMAPECLRLVEWWGGGQAAREISVEFQRMRTELLTGLTDEQERFYQKVRLWADRGLEVTQVGDRAYYRLLKSNKQGKPWVRTFLLTRAGDGTWRIAGLYYKTATLSGYGGIYDFLANSPATHPAWGEMVEYKAGDVPVASGSILYIDFDNKKLYDMTLGGASKQWLVENGIDSKCGSKAVGGGGGLKGIDLLAQSAVFTRSLLTPLNVQLMSKQWKRFGVGGGGVFLFKTREGNIGVMVVSGDAKNYFVRFKMLDPTYLKSNATVLQAIQTDPRETAAYILACGLDRHLESDSTALVRSADVIEKIKDNQGSNPRRLDSVYVSGDVALAVTSKSHQDDYRRLILPMAREDGRWLVEDVHIETKENEGDALKAFLIIYPDAKVVAQIVPIGPKTNPPLDSDMAPQ